MIRTSRGRLTYGDARLLARAALTTTLIRVGLWVLPFRLMRRAVSNLATRSHATRASRPLDDVIWAVLVASRYVPRASCLTQSLSAQVLLAHHGYPAELRIGVACGNGELDAHAWVESDGRVVIGNVDLMRYTPLTK